MKISSSPTGPVYSILYTQSPDFKEQELASELDSFEEFKLQVSDLPILSDMYVMTNNTVIPFLYGRVAKLHQVNENTYIEVVDLRGDTIPITVFGIFSDDSSIQEGGTCLFYNLLINHFDNKLTLKFSDVLSAGFNTGNYFGPIVSDLPALPVLRTSGTYFIGLRELKVPDDSNHATWLTCTLSLFSL